MDNNGFACYRKFCEIPPLVLVEWHDTETEAVGWLAINSLLNGAAGGGTRMRLGATRDEAISLAKTMEIKFKVAGPPIGGAKSVINFDPEDPRKESVLERWFLSIGSYLRHCYGTAGDFGVDEQDFVIPITRKLLGLRHPQEGIIRGYSKTNESAFYQILNQMIEGLEREVCLENVGAFRVAGLTTGFGVARSLLHFFQLTGQELKEKRVLLEGLGAVAGPTAYYLAQAGAKVVAVITKRDSGFQVARNLQGLDIVDLLSRRENKRHLPSDYPCKDSTGEFWQTRADIFVTATSSYSITVEKLRQLRNLGVQVIVGAANNPFAESSVGSTEVQEEADQYFSVIPDFIANCGRACAFAYLMHERCCIESASIFKAVDQTIQQAIRKVLDGTNGNTGLLGHAYSLFLSESSPTYLATPQLISSP